MLVRARSRNNASAKAAGYANAFALFATDVRDVSQRCRELLCKNGLGRVQRFNSRFASRGNTLLTRFSLVFFFPFDSFSAFLDTFQSVQSWKHDSAQSILCKVGGFHVNHTYIYIYITFHKQSYN